MFKFEYVEKQGYSSEVKTTVEVAEDATTVTMAAAFTQFCIATGYSQKSVLEGMDEVMTDYEFSTKLEQEQAVSITSLNKRLEAMGRLVDTSDNHLALAYERIEQLEGSNYDKLDRDEEQTVKIPTQDEFIRDMFKEELELAKVRPFVPPIPYPGIAEPVYPGVIQPGPGGRGILDVPQVMCEAIVQEPKPIGEQPTVTLSDETFKVANRDYSGMTVTGDIDMSVVPSDISNLTTVTAETFHGTPVDGSLDRHTKVEIKRMLTDCGAVFEDNSSRAKLLELAKVHGVLPTQAVTNMDREAIVNGPWMGGDQTEYFKEEQRKIDEAATKMFAAIEARNAGDK